ncbi:MAG: hypothetical protein AAGD25_14790 [Cyanobacteria bacterium P01_F01_bin.150]
MTFSSYKSLGETLKEFQTMYVEDNFIQELAFPVSQYFRDDLQFTLDEGVADSTEYAICENIVYPILKDVWKTYASRLTLWSHKYLNLDAQLSGYPEYILARRSPLGRIVFDKPYLMLVEAKQDDFDNAWGQCLAEMIAAQRLNDIPDLTVFGIASNGNFWQFGKLEGNQFMKHKKFYTIQNLDSLFAAINFMFQQCDLQLKQFIAA